MGFSSDDMPHLEIEETISELTQLADKITYDPLEDQTHKIATELLSQALGEETNSLFDIVYRRKSPNDMDYTRSHKDLLNSFFFQTNLYSLILKLSLGFYSEEDNLPGIITPIGENTWALLKLVKYRNNILPICMLIDTSKGVSNIETIKNGINTIPKKDDPRYKQKNVTTYVASLIESDTYKYWLSLFNDYEGYSAERVQIFNSLSSVKTL